MQKPIIVENESDEIYAINCKPITPMGWHPQPVEPFSEPVHRLLSSSLSTGTQRGYAADLAHFRASGRDIPCPPRALAEYLADLAETHAVATIQRRLAAIAKAHRALGYDDPCKTEIVKATMSGIRRTKGMAQREAQALQRDDLFAVLERMDDWALPERLVLIKPEDFA
ncbi:hypothetical protein [Sphingopyxis yananensis]|uniref:hypothetical protein n=1 Tax=Sphingopyxis yananensis TaxID=2886687 RepID=UPI001D12C315|nr:hypothetical protein [Sphingopyxis yananensis]MCC2601605.1 hypothetical protein [Sphingopyxis yananensis]